MEKQPSQPNPNPTRSVCEKIRMGSYCLSAGPLAESAFKAMLDMSYAL